MASHIFVFFFAIVCNVTPPVVLAVGVAVLIGLYFLQRGRVPREGVLYPKGEPLA